MGSLCELLFWGAHLNGEGSEESGEYLSSLIDLEKNEHSADNNALTYESYIGGLFLGQLYRCIADRANPRSTSKTVSP
jgi:hypothetical protein